ncbi:MAG: tripartite tricarboxylate transporter TctB family protein [Peptococcaceae bacterium]
MKKADQITGSILLALSVYIMKSAASLVLWNEGAPGPGFVPFWVGIFLAICSVVLIMTTLGKKYQQQDRIFSKEGFQYLTVVCGSAIVAGLIVNVVGMVLAMGLMAGVLVTVLSEERKIITSLGTVVVLPMVFYLIFKIALDVPLPMGIFGF